MKYDFDKIINRADTNCVKYDLRQQVFGNPDVLPMWVADMDFETPDFVRKAVIERASILCMVTISRMMPITNPLWDG